VNALLKDVKSGKAKLNPTVPTPEGFRGKIKYDRGKRIGCQLCVRVCPVNALRFTNEFLLADYKKD
jgi:formate hydrogenlyase subunit 6/NADH:ubiquinone oxidoreductase subunit I